jgi:hypothetical protein
VRVPQEYTDRGAHRLLIRMYSDPRAGIPNESAILIGNYDSFLEFRMEREIGQRYLRVLFTVSFLVSAVFCIVLFFGFNRKTEFIVFCLYCLANARLAFNLPVRIFGNFDFIFLRGDFNINPIVYFISAESLLLYLLIKFSAFGAHRLFALVILILPVSALILPQNVVSEGMFVFYMTVIPLLLALYGVFKRFRGGTIILTGLACSAALIYLERFGMIANGYYLNVMVIILAVLVLSSREIAFQSRAGKEAVLRSTRLELELLKRNIQPHFILNTLSSLQEIVEQSPGMASDFIQSLAEEFRMFSKVSGEKLIPAADEIGICKAHLRIMEFRKGVKFEFLTEGMDGTETVPPGIFHTLVENGTTHGYVTRKSGRFVLTKEQLKSAVRYTMFNDSETESGENHIRLGTGLRYIETRLEESFPGSWKLTSVPAGNGWKTVIEIGTPEAQRNDRNDR